MYVLDVRNVEEAQYRAVDLLQEHGINTGSRNGPVKMSREPVTTVYRLPWERVLLSPRRDANPFFHLYESLWMLAGRNDVESVARYAGQMREYSDNGLTLHDAYGFRWRYHFERDQIEDIISALWQNRTDRRAVLAMWDARVDSGRKGLAVPCNLTATFQISQEEALEIVVFNRSNDVVWGAYGANAVQFSMLQEYISARLGLTIGSYTQVSVNWHAYHETMHKLGDGSRLSAYEDGEIRWLPMSIGAFHRNLNILLNSEATGFVALNLETDDPWWKMVSTMLRAHARWRKRDAGRYDEALEILKEVPPDIDWVTAGREWLLRRKQAAQDQRGIK